MAPPVTKFVSRGVDPFSRGKDCPLQPAFAGGGMGTRSRLSILMGLAYAVQGAWWPLLAVHLTDLGVSGRGRGWIFATLAISALITPPIAGRLADRSIAAQRLLALIYALGTALLL